MPLLLDVNKFNRLYRRTITADGDGSKDVYLKLKPIAPGVLRVLTQVTVENQTDTTTKCRLGIDHGGIKHYLDELQNMTAGELAVSRSDILLGEGDCFFAKLEDTHDPDKLIMTCCGWEQRLK